MNPRASGGASGGASEGASEGAPKFLSGIHMSDDNVNLTETSTIDLHRRFCAIIMLHTLVSAINYNGRPLFSAAIDGDPKPFIASLKDGQPIRNRLLNAVTALLANSLKFRKTDPLVNHAATLEDTFNTYRSIKEQLKHESLIVEFSKYIVARC